MKDKEKFKGFMIMVGELFDKNLSKELLDVYWQILEPFSDAKCEQAFKKVLATTKFFPKPADFLECLQDGAPHMVAWETAFKAIGKTGPYVSVKFSDPAINLVIKLMGGWTVFCTLENEDIKWKQIEFEKIYKGISQNAKFPGHLPGIHEQTSLRNQRIGYDLPVVMIGEPIEIKQLGA